MKADTKNLAVTFADICSSTSYFKEHGDAVARSIVTDCLDCAAEIVTALGGTVIDRIGDEILCINPDLDNGIQSSLSIQRAVNSAASEGKLPAGIKMRIGMHYGPVIIEEGRIFGDTIHTAKRLVDLAKRDQILTSAQTLSAALNPSMVRSRLVDRVRIKGQEEPMEIIELLGENLDLTQAAQPLYGAGEFYRTCQITCGRQEFAIDESNPVLTIGRVAPSDIIVPQRCVSRQHARIEYQKGRIIFIDLSTNGTFVSESPLTEGVLVRREQRWLRHRGTLRLGHDQDKDGSLTLSYVCS